MDLTPPSEKASRVRAAIAYSGLDDDEIVERTGIKPGTLRNLVSRTRPSGHDKTDRLRRIADACEVPYWFLDAGWSGAPAKPEVNERLLKLEQQVSLLAARALEAGLPKPPGALDRQPANGQTNAEGQPPPGSVEKEDVR